MRSRFSINLAVLALLATCFPAVAADKPAKKGKPKVPPPEVIELTLHPALPPAAAFEHRLLPQYLDQNPGDAAPLYTKAALLLTQEKVSNDTWKKIGNWHRTPLDKLPLEEVRQTLEPFEDLLEIVEMGSRRMDCDWGLAIREAENALEIQLPELQSIRPFARLLGLRARLEIAQKEYDKAFGTLQTGFALARHTARRSTLIGGLVGLSTAAIIDAQLEALIQSPDVPNLYWTITALPRPLIDLRGALQLEAVLVYLMLPEFQQAAEGSLTAEQWHALLEHAIVRFDRIIFPGDDDRPTLDEIIKDVHPPARTLLVARGMSQQEVDAMPPAQVVLLGVFKTYNEWRDDMFKWFSVPYWQAYEGIEQAQQRLEIEGKQEMISALPSLFLPAIGRAYFQVAKAERRTAALRCIEAIRLYAAAHDGQLPASLSAITEVPIPINPTTGEPFGYSVEGDTAILEADSPPGDPHQHFQRQYHLKLAK